MAQIIYLLASHILLWGVYFIENYNFESKRIREGGKRMRMEIIPVTFKVACKFVNEHHRHHKAPQGHKFSIAVCLNGKMVGVAIVGRPVSRYLDDCKTVEATRLCTDGTKNACSKLYGACSRIAKEMGYKSIITYTLISENGASLKASGFTNEGKAGGLHWTGKRDNGQAIPAELKFRWRKLL